MNALSPKPEIARVVHQWNVVPGMTFSVVEDTEKNIWIAEACPVGTHYWTLEQAAELPQGTRTRAALQQAIRAGLRLQAAAAKKQAAQSGPLTRRCAAESLSDSVTASHRKVSEARPLARRRSVETSDAYKPYAVTKA